MTPIACMTSALEWRKVVKKTQINMTDVIIGLVDRYSTKKAIWFLHTNFFMKLVYQSNRDIILYLQWIMLKNQRDGYDTIKAAEEAHDEMKDTAFSPTTTKNDFYMMSPDSILQDLCM